MRRQVWLDSKIKGAESTNRESLSRVEKIKKLPPGSLWKLPDVDENIFYLWGYFREVFSGGELSFQEIGAWATLTGRKLTPLEVETLRKLAFAALEQRNAKS